MNQPASYRTKKVSSARIKRSVMSVKKRPALFVEEDSRLHTVLMVFTLIALVAVITTILTLEDKTAGRLQAQGTGIGGPPPTGEPVGASTSGTNGAGTNGDGTTIGSATTDSSSTTSSSSTDSSSTSSSSTSSTDSSSSSSGTTGTSSNTSGTTSNSTTGTTTGPTTATNSANTNTSTSASSSSTGTSPQTGPTGDTLTGSDVGDISPLVTTGTGTGTGTIIPNGQSGTTPPLIEVYNAEGQNDSLLGMNRNILAARLTPFARPVIVIAQKIAGRLSPVLTSTTGLLTVLVALSEAGSLAAVASTPGGLASLGRALFPFLAVRPRPSPWGRVVEEGTNRPVSNVVLTIMDEAGKVRATTKSQTNGTFGVLLPRGTYHLTVTAPGYALASAPSSVPLFPNELLYTGGTFTVAQDEVVLPLVVVLRAENPAMARGKASKKGEFMTKARLWQAHWAIPLLLIGAALHTLALVQNPTYPLITIGLLYIFFLILELLLSRVVRRAIGRVYDHLQHRPVPLALVRLLEPITNRVVATEVTTTKGQFLMMPPPGVYRLQVMHSQYDPYLKDSLRISKWNAGVAPVTVELHSPQPTPPSAPHVSWVPGLQQTA